jgi:hypothetical protein
MRNSSKLCTLFVTTLLVGYGSSSTRQGIGIVLADSTPHATIASTRFVLAEDEFDREVTPPVDGSRWGTSDSTVHPGESEPAGNSGDRAPALEQPKTATPRAPKQTTSKNKAVRPAPPAPVYACPMHPEVTDTKPSKCPKCGMTLVRKSS